MKVKFLILTLFITLNMFSQNEKDTVNILDEVRIEGVRASKNMPVPQITLQRKELQKFHQGYEISQILDDTPSITSSADGGHSFGYTSFRIRGVDQTRINMTLNGVPLNEPEDQGVYFSNYPNFLETISSLQIQRGVGTSTNGVSSYGGSINFISHVGQEKELDIKLMSGSFDTKLVNFSFGSGLIKEKLSLFLNMSSYESNGYKKGSGGRGQSLFLAGNFKNGKDIFRLTLFNGNSTNGMAWLPVSETDINNDPRTNYNENDAWDDFIQTFTQIEYNRLLNSNTKFTVTGFYTKLIGEYDYYMVGTNYFFLNSDFFGVNTNFNKRYKGGELNVGINGNSYQREHESTFEFDSFRNTGYKQETNAYIKLSQKIGVVTLFGDAQFRYVDFKYNGSVEMPNLKWNFFNPKAGLKVNLEPSLNLYTLIGKTHREPTRSNLFGGSDNFVELSNIVAEEALDYELGLNYKDSRVDFNLNLYYMDFKNEITSNGEYGENSLLLFYNAPRSYRSGLELNLNYKFDNGFGVNYNSNFTKNGIIGSDLVQLYSPEIIENLGLTYDRKGLKLGLNAKYHSTSFIDIQNEFTTPEFITFNANVGYTYKQISLYLTMLNLTNQEFFTNGSVIDGERYFFVNAPLNYNLTFKVSL